MVTGAARGIGAGIVEKLLSEGHNVSFCDIPQEAEMQEQVQALAAKYPQCKVVYVKCDVTNAAERQNFLDKTIAALGSVTALVNNAGVAPKVRLDVLETTEESFSRLLTINLQGPFFLTQLVANYMAKHQEPGQCIVNMSSCSAEVASVSRGEYCISKAGVSMATKLWAVRLAEFGINVYEIRPGVIKTPMTEVVTAKYDKLIAEGLTLTPRWGFPEDIAKVVAAFIRGDLAYSTGQVVSVDGGMQIQKL
jgi:NAD(P)-dependent dehydrogenase (short-subunit alcohol dehydrogenase family)